MKVYLDFNDWWIGVYRGPNHWYICPLPTLVLRFRRRLTDPEAAPLSPNPALFCQVCGYGPDFDHHLHSNAKGYHPFISPEGAP